ncbi:serine/threonine protein kinase (SRPK2) [Plasmodium malariae]|uniref:Serine/threonine protein kinase (SRPK2) n=1 Tax=Plasmodium malariae TaxID=5858 RepID=A0A1A8WCG2_PLAMA|nr:serine/threonine protein kinase (SRPK2) [Plasmodium malariae]
MLKGDCLISLFDIVEEFNNYCMLYKKKHANSFNISSNVLTKNERNKEINEFNYKFNDFMNKLSILYKCILEKKGTNKDDEVEGNKINSKDTDESQYFHYNSNDIGETICIQQNNDEIDEGDRAGSDKDGKFYYKCTIDMEDEYDKIKNLNTEKILKERNKRKIDEKLELGKINKMWSMHEQNPKLSSSTNRYDILAACNNNNNNNNNIDYNNNKYHLVTFEEFPFHSNSNSSNSSSLTNTEDSSNENNDFTVNRRSDVLIKYVTGLDYTLNVRRVSKEYLIEEIKEFYRIHNNSIKLDEYSKYLSYETINMLKKKVDNNKNGTFDFMGNYNNIFKAENFFFNVPINYFFIRNYEEQTGVTMSSSNYTNYEKSLNGVNTYSLSNNSSSINGNNYNIYTDSILLSRNNSYNKCNSPMFGSDDRQLSPNFGTYNGTNKSEEVDNYEDENYVSSEKYQIDENNKFYRSPYCYNEEIENKHFRFNSKNEPIAEKDEKLNKCSTIPSKMFNHFCNSPKSNSNIYENEDKVTRIHGYIESENYETCEINNIVNKKNNLNSNRSDFYQSISDFYKCMENHNYYNCSQGKNNINNYSYSNDMDRNNKESKNNTINDNNHDNSDNNKNNITYNARSSSPFLVSNETSVQGNSINFQENGKNINNLYFDDELSNAITLENEPCINKEMDDNRENHLSDRNIKDTNTCYEAECKYKSISEEDNVIKKEKLIQYEKEENRWIDEYCNGNYNLFRSKQLKKKKELKFNGEYNVTNDILKLEDTGNNVKNERININLRNGHYNGDNDSHNRSDSDSDMGTVKDVILENESNYDNTYNVINLKIVYETNKSEFCILEEMNFFPGQIIINKYKVIKVLSKTKFSTTLKCLNILYKRGGKRKDVCCTNKTTKDEKINANKKNIYDNVINFDTQKMSTGFKTKNATCNGHSIHNKYLNMERKSLLTNKGRIKKDYKYVCLKVMKNGKSFLDQGLFELIVLNMLSSESNTTKGDSYCTLTNKNIIQLYDYFYFKEHLVIVTEYMQSDLYNYFIKKGKLGTLGQLQILAKNLLDGLAYIHSKNLIHCDLKPENIMINMKRGKNVSKRDSKEETDVKYNTNNTEEKAENKFNSTTSNLSGALKNRSFVNSYNAYIAESYEPSFMSNENDIKDVGEIKCNSYQEANKSEKNNLVILKNLHENNETCEKDNILLSKCGNYSRKCYDKYAYEKDTNTYNNKGNCSNNSDKTHIFSCEKFDKIKIIDFNSSIYESDKLEMYVQTRSYRSPEVLLQQNYDRKIDMWSLGCILFEFLTKNILFDHQNIYRFIYSIVSYIGPFPFYMINGCRIPYVFTKHGLIILNKITVDKNYDNYFKEEQVHEIDDDPVIFNSKDFFRLNKNENFINDLLRNKSTSQSSQFLSKERNQEVYYDVCSPSNNLLKHNFQISDLLFLDFLLSLLQIDPCKRLNSIEALEHPWLRPQLYEDGL